MLIKQEASEAAEDRADSGNSAQKTDSGSGEENPAQKTRVTPAENIIAAGEKINSALSHSTCIKNLYSLDCGNMEVYTLGSMVPMGGGSSGLVKLLSGWVGRTQAVGMVRLVPTWASSAAVVAAGAPGTGPTVGTCSPGGAEEPGRRGAACCGGGCCWRRGLEEASEAIAKDRRRRRRG